MQAWSAIQKRAQRHLVSVPRCETQKHMQCAWCGRLKHDDEHPHGQPLPWLEEYSHGICSECLGELVAQYARSGVDLAERLAALRSQVRPKLASSCQELSRQSARVA